MSLWDEAPVEVRDLVRKLRPELEGGMRAAERGRWGWIPKLPPPRIDSDELLDRLDELLQCGAERGDAVQSLADQFKRSARTIRRELRRLGR